MFSRRNLKVIGLCVSLAYLFVVAALSYRSRQAFLDLDPNNWGDFLAGAFGPLALFWLVLGFFQQGYELRNSADALRIQAQELKNSVEAQKNLVVSADRQIAQEISMRTADLWLEAKKLEADITRKIHTLDATFSVFVKKTHGTRNWNHDLAVDFNKLEAEKEQIKEEFSKFHPVANLDDNEFDENTVAKAYNWNSQLDLIIEKMQQLAQGAP